MPFYLFPFIVLKGKHDKRERRKTITRKITQEQTEKIIQ